MSITAMKQALEALQIMPMADSDCDKNSQNEDDQIQEAITALSDAIAEAEKAEPVAWVEVKDRHEGPYEFHGKELLDSGKHYLYTHPRQPKEWVGLSSYDMDRIRQMCQERISAVAFIAIDNALEAKNGETP